MFFLLKTFYFYANKIDLYHNDLFLASFHYTTFCIFFHLYCRYHIIASELWRACSLELWSWKNAENACASLKNQLIAYALSIYYDHSIAYMTVIIIPNVC